MDTLSARYARLLGLDDSWRVEVRLARVGSGVSCPKCGQSCGRSDHAEEQRWRHLVAELVHDTFHVAEHLGEAVNQVRRAENKALLAEDDDRLEGTRQLQLFDKANPSPKQQRRFAAIRQNGLKTARAWAIKEEFRWFWRHVYPTSAEDFFSQWYALGVRCRLRPVIKVSQMLRRHLPNLLSYFRHRIINAASEGFNSAIESWTYAARSFRSFENDRTRIPFFCGKLALRPRLPCH